jgi:hypothetical protein
MHTLSGHPLAMAVLPIPLVATPRDGVTASMAASALYASFTPNPKK